MKTNPPGRGLDIGTENLVVAALDAEGGVRIRRDRNAFLELPAALLDYEDMLTQLGVPYVLHQKRLFVLGNAPEHLRYLTGAKAERAVPGGVLSPKDQDAISITRFLFERLLGAPVTDGEPIVYSVPSPPSDWQFDGELHEGIVSGMLRKRGFVPRPITESGAVVYSEMADSGFTGVALSFGHSRVDACVARSAEPISSLSVDRGAGWVDSSVARIMGTTLLKATEARRKDFDLSRPRSRLQQAAAHYYRLLVRYTITNLRQALDLQKDRGGIDSEVPVVLAGGASLPDGFVDLCARELEALGFPLGIADVRRARAPRTSVARGCLLSAVAEEALAS